MSPFGALYGFSPPKVLDYVPSLAKVVVVDIVLHDRSILLNLLKQNLVAAQAQMKAQVDLHRFARFFQVDDWVFLRLQPYRHLSLHSKGFQKLSPRYFGPFQILQRIGSVAYKLALPLDCLIHPVFHVSCLKPKLGAHITPIPTLPPMDANGCLNPKPIAIIQHRSKQLRSRQITEVLVQCFGHLLNMLLGSLCTSCNFNSLNLWSRCFEWMLVLLPHFIFPSSCCNGHFIFTSSCYNLMGIPMLQLYFMMWARYFKGVVLVYLALLLYWCIQLYFITVHLI